MSDDSMTVTAPGGNYGGSGGNGNGGNKDTSYDKASVSVVKPGEVVDTPYGKIIVNARGEVTMNGIVMNEENSSMVSYKDQIGSVRVLNSLISNPSSVVNPNAKGSAAMSAVNNNLALRLANSWASAGQISSVQINNSILDAVNNQLPSKNQSAVSTPSFKTLRDIMDTQPSRLQKNTAAQITNAWQRAYQTMPDKIPQTKTTGGSNGSSTTVMVNNAKKRKLAEALPQVSADIQKTLAQKQTTEADAKKAALNESKVAEKARQAGIDAAKISGAGLSTPDAQSSGDSAAKDSSARAQAATTAVSTASAMRQAADRTSGAAAQADKAFNDLQNKVYGMDVKDGKYGTYRTTSTGGSNGTTKTIFSDSGISIQQLDTARKHASDMRQAANKSEADAAAAEAAAGKATKSAYDAESRRQAAQASLTSARNKNDADILIKASEVISGAGKDIGEKLGAEYKSLYESLSGDIRNFQGKSIRSYNDAVKSLNAVLDNPSLKIKAADRDALVNAWNAVDANSFSQKYGYLSKSFKVADIALKVRAVTEKSVVGYKTGNWGPLMLEVESMVLAGVTTAAVMGLISIILGALPISTLAVTALTIAAIIAVAIITSAIDGEKAAALNNKVSELIK